MSITILNEVILEITASARCPSSPACIVPFMNGKLESGIYALACLRIADEDYFTMLTFFFTSSVGLKREATSGLL